MAKILAGELLAEPTMKSIIVIITPVKITILLTAIILTAGAVTVEVMVVAETAAVVAIDDGFKLILA